MPTITEQVLALPASDLVPIVRKILDETAELTGSWAAEPIGAGPQ